MRSLGVIAVATCLGLFAACTDIAPGSAPAHPLHIGVELPLSGPQARAAEPALNGIRFYVKQHPRIADFDVVLTTADDTVGGKSSAARGVGNVQRFLADPNLVAMIGPFSAAVARKEIPVANAGGLAMVTPATSNPCLTRDIFLPAMLNTTFTPITCKAAGLPSASELRPTHVNNFFRLTTTDDLQGAAAADFATGTLHVLRVAVISDHEAYGQGLAHAFGARLTRLGGQVVGRLDLDPKLPDATEFLKTAKARGAQAVYFGGTSRDGDCAIRAQMKTIFDPGTATPFLSGDGVAQDPTCIKDAGDNALGIYATVPLVDAEASMVAADTIKAFKAAHGRVSEYGLYTMVAYDATAVLYSAIRRAIDASGGKLPARTDVIAQLAATTGMPAMTGFIGFDRFGDTTNRQISVFQSTGADPRSPWYLARTIDYTAALPY